PRRAGGCATPGRHRRAAARGARKRHGQVRLHRRRRGQVPAAAAGGRRLVRRWLDHQRRTQARRPGRRGGSCEALPDAAGRSGEDYRQRGSGVRKIRRSRQVGQESARPLRQSGHAIRGCSLFRRPARGFVLLALRPEEVRQPHMFSRFFIDRPIFAAVLSIFIVIAGLAAMRVLPIAQYPEIAPPVVTVRAVYPGASAQVLEQTVAAPIENQINGVENMLYMSSSSTSNGAVEIQVTFEIAANVDTAGLNVNNRVRQVGPRLPQEVRRQGVTVEKGSSSFLQVLAFTSPDGSRDDLFISNYVTLNVLDSLKRIPGTTNVQIFGAKDYAMRVWVRPDRLAQLKVAPADLLRALNEQNAQFAAGKIGQSPTGGPQELVSTITTRGRLSEPEEFANIVIRANPDGSILRLKDVARVELGSKDYEFMGRVNGRSATLVGIFLQPGANALATAKLVTQAMYGLSQRFPSGLTHSVVYDTTRLVAVSIREVVNTLLEAMALVFLVVFLFLQNWRATLIPFAAVPVSLIGTFAGLTLLGYSINTLTLFGMVLAIGIVVDDAIVVLENVERIMHEEHLGAREAAIKAMKEVTSPIIAIVLTLCAVFVPIAFLGGLTGELYRQFAVTISIAVVISGLVALTLTPSLCVLILKRRHREPGRFFRWFNSWFGRMT